MAVRDLLPAAALFGGAAALRGITGTADSTGGMTDIRRKAPGATAPYTAAVVSPSLGMTSQEAASCGGAWGRRIEG